MSLKSIKTLFLISAIYDLILGVVFFFFFKTIYGMFGSALPNNDVYVQFPALLIFIFGLGFYFVYQDPVRNRDLVTMGILMKIAFCGVVFWHYFLGGIPSFYLPFAVIDVIFALFFISSSLGLKRAEPAK